MRDTGNHYKGKEEANSLVNSKNPNMREISCFYNEKFDCILFYYPLKTTLKNKQTHGGLQNTRLN